MVRIPNPKNSCQNQESERIAISTTGTRTRQASTKQNMVIESAETGGKDSHSDNESVRSADGSVTSGGICINPSGRLADMSGDSLFEEILQVITRSTFENNCIVSGDSLWNQFIVSLEDNDREPKKQLIFDLMTSRARANLYAALQTGSEKEKFVTKLIGHMDQKEIYYLLHLSEKKIDKESVSVKTNKK